LLLVNQIGAVQSLAGENPRGDRDLIPKVGDALLAFKFEWVEVGRQRPAQAGEESDRWKEVVPIPSVLVRIVGDLEWRRDASRDGRRPIECVQTTVAQVEDMIVDLSLLVAVDDRLKFFDELETDLVFTAFWLQWKFTRPKECHRVREYNSQGVVPSWVIGLESPGSSINATGYEQQAAILRESIQRLAKRRQLAIPQHSPLPPA
jgi:hypothetical protein